MRTANQEANILLDLNKKMMQQVGIGFQLQDYFGCQRLAKFVSDNHLEKYKNYSKQIEDIIKKFKKYNDLEVLFRAKGFDYEMIIQFKSEE